MEYLHAWAISSRTGARTARRGGVRGFTLVELLVTMAIAGIVLALAVPSMTQFLAEQSAAGNADELAEALRYARSEAIKSGRSVEICASSDYKTCGKDWATGWVVLGSGSNTILRVQNALRAVDSVTAGATSLTFGATGLVIVGGNTSFTFTPIGGDTSRARVVTVSTQGRVNVTKGAS